MRTLFGSRSFRPAVAPAVVMGVMSVDASEADAQVGCELTSHCVVSCGTGTQCSFSGFENCVATGCSYNPFQCSLLYPNLVTCGTGGGPVLPEG